MGDDRQDGPHGPDLPGGPADGPRASGSSPAAPAGRNRTVLLERAEPPVSKPLGEYLGCPGRLLQQALLVQAERKPRRRVGEILLARDVVDAEALRGAVARQRIDRLRSCVLFSSLDDDQLAKLSDVFREVTVESGLQFINEGDRVDSLYVLAAGQCIAFRNNGEDEEVQLSRMLPGEPVGELGYFASGARMASVRAVETCQLLRATYEDLSDCFESVPEVATVFMETITRRLRKANLLYQENHYAGVADDGLVLGPLNELLDVSKVEGLERSVDRLLVRTVQWASRLTDADRASLFLVDPDNGELWSRVVEGRRMNEIRLPAGSGVVGWVIKHNEMVNIEDAYSDARFNRKVDQSTGYSTHTMLCAPVRGSGRVVIGALQVINKRSGAFTDEDEGLLRLLAGQTALNVENIERSRLVVSDYRRMASLLEITTALAQATELNSLSALVGRRLARILKADRVEVLFLDRDGETLFGASDAGVEFSEIGYKASEGLLGHALNEGRSLNVPDPYDSDDFDAELDRAGDRRTRSLLIMPMRDRQGALCGVVQAINHDDGPFDQSDESLLRSIAAQIGTSALLNR